MTLFALGLRSRGHVMLIDMERSKRQEFLAEAKVDRRWIEDDSGNDNTKHSDTDRNRMDESYLEISLKLRKSRWRHGRFSTSVCLKRKKEN